MENSIQHQHWIDFQPLSGNVFISGTTSDHIFLTNMDVTSFNLAQPCRSCSKNCQMRVLCRSEACSCLYAKGRGHGVPFESHRRAVSHYYTEGNLSLGLKCVLFAKVVFPTAICSHQDWTICSHQDWTSSLDACLDIPARHIHWKLPHGNEKRYFLHSAFI